jgi:hydrogenase maturation protein HypF
LSTELQHTNIKTTRIRLSGLIQGIGFRPFVYKLAKHYKLNGEVINQNNGVHILVQGNEQDIGAFIAQIKIRAPKAAIITLLEQEIIYRERFGNFSIGHSKTISGAITMVSPDIAVCQECLEDMKTEKHRLGYPFTNCTNCGPRFSIIENIPYDRSQTSMKIFDMCPDCSAEYKDINNRRFHAQPIACNTCGPSYFLYSGQKENSHFESILTIIGEAIDSGEVVAMKGLGGFHLACDAYNPQALLQLRKIKKRDSKPFAIMADSIETARKLAILTPEEEATLLSWQRPILLAKAKNKNEFPHEIAGGLNTLGIFLPYLPFHYQLFEHIKPKVLVMTSANLSQCPILTDEKEAISHFGPFNLKILAYNRPIVNRVDDSVVFEGPLGKQLIRRARGYTPLPVMTHIDVDSILATGAELSGAFVLGKERLAILSQFIGDLKNYETLQFYEESYARFRKLFKFSPRLIACDMHPDYSSTTFARHFGLPVIEVQHHHAHIAATMAEYGLDEKVIGIAYDGTGYGTDGKTWGSEIMVADYHNFERKFHFEYVPVPGGDKVAEEPWRSAFAYLYHAYQGKIPDNLDFLKKINQQHNDLIRKALVHNINIPESCSAGRLFDAVAALINVCTHTSYHAEAPIKLEHILRENVHDYYPFELKKSISWSNTIRGIVTDLHNNVAPSVIAAKFHNTVALVTVHAVLALQKETGINKLILSGGTFQNVYLTKKIVDLLKNTKMQLFISHQIPCNDSGIALGQLLIAAKKNELCV